MRIASELGQQVLAGWPDRGLRRERRGIRRARRRRRLWAGLIGGVLGWGIAGLDGGIAGTPVLPQLSVGYVASGILASAELGAVPFEVATNGRFFRQTLMVQGEELVLVFDRDRGTITVVDASEVLILPAHQGMEDIFEPFTRATSVADAPLEVVRQGVGSHLGLACERYQATGTSKGAPLRASACVTSDGIPLLSEVVIGGSVMRTEFRDLATGTPASDLFTIPTDRTIIDLAGR